MLQLPFYLQAIEDKKVRSGEVSAQIKKCTKSIRANLFITVVHSQGHGLTLALCKREVCMRPEPILRALVARKGKENPWFGTGKKMKIHIRDIHTVEIGFNMSPLLGFDMFRLFGRRPCFCHAAGTCSFGDLRESWRTDTGATASRVNSVNSVNSHGCCQVLVLYMILGLIAAPRRKQGSSSLVYL